MTRTLATETTTKIGEEVLLQGWIDARRDHGKITFLDLRDRSGVVQLVLNTSDVKGIRTSEVSSVRPEYVIEVMGLVKERLDGQSEIGYRHSRSRS